MTVKEYAEELHLSVAEVLKKCRELNINASNATDELTDDDIIFLDNTLNLISNDNDISYDEDELVENIVYDIMESKNIKDTSTKTKEKKTRVNNNDEFQQLKKEMYKHKEKLKSNTEVDENIVLYKDGMTVNELAKELDVNGTDIIKKLMSLGLMISLNDHIDYDNAEIVALDYNKTLKKESTQDITNFEELEIIDNEKDLVKRPPIITISVTLAPLARISVKAA